MNIAQAKFSVAMCVWGKDNAEHFQAAVESIVHQTLKPNEVIIVVDGPVPEEIEAILAKCDSMPLFKIVRFSENRGHGEARRASIEACTNEIVALMDADDISLPNRFEEQLNYLLKEQADIVGGDIAEFIGEECNVVSYRRVPCRDEEIKQYMRKRSPFNQVSVMFRKSVYDSVGGYQDWYCNEDYYLWLRMFRHGAVFANTGTVLVNVRVGDDMYKRRGGRKYFQSEKKLQKYMLTHRIIDRRTYAVNVAKRWIVQCCMPNAVRGWAFRKFARKSV